MIESFDNKLLNKKENAILIGAGSVGKSHAIILSKLVKKLYVVDPNNAALEWCSSNLDCELYKFNVLSDALKHSNLTLVGSIAVIANWGLDHAQTFFELAKYGIKNFFMEKPFTHSLKNIDEIVDFSIKNEINILSGFQLRHSGLGDLIVNTSKHFLGGNPSLISLDGGANCIVTNGIHYLDLACSVFNSNPLEVSAQLKDSRINPRGKHLGYWEGVSSWKFTNDCQLSVAFSNQSSVSLSCKIYAKNGYLKIFNEGDFVKILIYKRNPVEVEIDSRITRYGVAELDKSNIIKHGLEDTVQEMFLSLFNSNNIFDLKKESIAAKSIIGALISSNLKKTVSLPIAKNHDLFETEWPIS